LIIHYLLHYWIDILSFFTHKLYPLVHLLHMLHLSSMFLFNRDFYKIQYQVLIHLTFNYHLAFLHMKLDILWVFLSSRDILLHRVFLLSSWCISWSSFNSSPHNTQHFHSFARWCVPNPICDRQRISALLSCWKLLVMYPKFSV